MHIRKCGAIASISGNLKEVPTGTRLYISKYKYKSEWPLFLIWGRRAIEFSLNFTIVA